MEKPITVAMREYSESLVDVTNNAQLPTFLKKQIVKELLTALSELDDRERAEAEKAWADAQQEAEDETDG